MPVVSTFTAPKSPIAEPHRPELVVVGGGGVEEEGASAAGKSEQVAELSGRDPPDIDVPRAGFATDPCAVVGDPAAHGRPATCSDTFRVTG